MRLLQLHADFIEYTPISKELKDAEDEIKLETKRLDNLVVAFVCIEKYDDRQIIDKALNEIKNYLENIKVNRLLIYPYAHLSSDLASPKNAFEFIIELEKLAKKNH